MSKLIKEIIDGYDAPRITPNVILVSEKQIEHEEHFLPMLHGKATDAIAAMAGEKLAEDKINNTGIVDAGDVKLILNQFNELSGTLGVSTHKLLSTAVTVFTKNNHTGKVKDLRALRVHFPLRDYAKKCGYDVEIHIRENMTAEQIQKETKRAENALKNARKKIKKDLVLLTSSSLYWEEKVRGKRKDFAIANILGKGEINKGNVVLEFTLTMGEYLVQLPITQYPMALLSLDERNNNAYVMGLKMTEHYNMDNNQKKGTAQLLKVKSLLQSTTFPNINNTSVKKNNWRNRIKEPFENALDMLTKCGLLENWRYSHSKGKEMTDVEATNFASYADWENTLIYFTLKDAVYNTFRLEIKNDDRK